MRARPELRIWHDPVAQLKVAQMRARAGEGAVEGVVFAGSSQVLEGVAPSLAAPGLGRRAYNAALHRGFLPLTERWLLQEVLPRLRPRLVVLGLGLLDLTDTGTAQHEVVERFEAAVARRPGRRAALLRAAHARSAVVRHGLAPLGPRTDLAKLQVGPDGEGLEFAAATEYRLSDKKRAYIEDELLADYRTGPASRSALERIAAGVRSTGAELVLVEMPHTEELVAMLPGGPPSLDAARAVLSEVAYGLSIVLLRQLVAMEDHRWFADCVHLNGSGMRRASEVLAPALAPHVALAVPA